MPPVQRQLTAIAALGLLFVVVACRSGDHEVALAGAAVVGNSSTTADAPDPTSEPAALLDPAQNTAPDAGAPNVTEPDRAASDLTAPDRAALSAIDAAVARGDTCGVYVGLARIDLSPSSDRLLAQLTRIREVMERSSAFVAASLAADWKMVIEGTGDMESSLRRDAASVSKSSGSKSSAAVFDHDRYRAASHRVGEWMDQNCA